MKSDDKKFPGGLLVGETDKNGGKGIKIVAPEGNILVGGGETILVSDASKSNKKYEFDGKETTPCEIMSKINHDHGGVKIPCDIAEPANTTDSKMEVGDVIKRAENGTKIPTESTEDKIKRLNSDYNNVYSREGDSQYAKLLKRKISFLKSQLNKNTMETGSKISDFKVGDKVKFYIGGYKDERLAHYGVIKENDGGYPNYDRHFAKVSGLGDPVEKERLIKVESSMATGGQIQDYQLKTFDVANDTLKAIKRDGTEGFRSIYVSPREMEEAKFINSVRYTDKLSKADIEKLKHIKRLHSGSANFDYLRTGIDEHGLTEISQATRDSMYGTKILYDGAKYLLDREGVKMESGGSLVDVADIEKYKLKYAKQDINLLEKEHGIAITDTKHGVLWGEHKNGIYSFTVQERGVIEPKRVFSGNKNEAIEFVKNAYTVEGMAGGGEISPLKQVRANLNVTISEVLWHFTDNRGVRIYKDLGLMEAGMLYNLRNKEGSKEVSDATGLKEQIYKKLEEKGYINVDYNDYTFTLTDEAKQFIDRVNNRLETRREVKRGYDLFPETSNIPELVMAEGGKLSEGKLGYRDFNKAYGNYYSVEHKWSSYPRSHVMGSIYNQYVANPGDFQYLDKYVEKEMASGGKFSYAQTIRRHIDGFSYEQEKNIIKIVNGIGELIGNDIENWGGGGNVYKLGLQLKNGKWIVFHNDTGDITLSKKLYKTAQDFYDDLGTDNSTTYDLYLPGLENDEDFTNTIKIIQDIKSNKFISTYA